MDITNNTYTFFLITDCQRSFIANNQTVSENESIYITHKGSDIITDDELLLYCVTESGVYPFYQGKTLADVATMVNQTLKLEPLNRTESSKTQVKYAERPTIKQLNRADSYSSDIEYPPVVRPDGDKTVNQFFNNVKGYLILTHLTNAYDSTKPLLEQCKTEIIRCETPLNLMYDYSQKFSLGQFITCKTNTTFEVLTNLNYLLNIPLNSSLNQTLFGEGANASHSYMGYVTNGVEVDGVVNKIPAKILALSQVLTTN